MNANRKFEPRFFVYILALVLAAFVGKTFASGTDAGVRWHEAGVARVHSGSSWVDVSAGVYTSYLPLITIEPPTGTGAAHMKVVLDLDSGDDSDSFNGGYTSETIQFCVARKIQGMWRNDNEAQTATITGTNAASRSVTLDVGIVGSAEDVRIMVKLSAEQSDIEIAYLCYYFAPNDCAFTDVSN